jgi:putative membrane protein
MRKAFSAAAALAILAAIPVYAQTSAPTTTSPAPAVTTPAAPSTATTTTTTPSVTDTSKPGAPVAGANSFTESQARARIESRGFTNVTELKKDEQSIWRGQATKDGKTVSVALDYQGNVVAD